MTNIEKNIKLIQNKILTIKTKQSISRDITIVAVSKTFPPSFIKKAFDCGLNNIGENRYQEAKPKIERLKNLKIKWHFIGTLQTNKIRKIMENFSLIQSIASIKHINKIDSIAEEMGIRYPFFIEINIGEEKNKSGFFINEIENTIAYIKNKKNIVLKGVMCIPPYSDNPENSRNDFKKMKILFDQLKKENNGENIFLEELSMGMSEDFEIAIEEGSTMVRIGRAIFGRRD